tara:strand:+ start:838 stop:1554 length:717 start_codon:yes stop_codon:yes gene_type:complete
MTHPAHCLIGANSTIAKTLIKTLLAKGDRVHLIARQENGLEDFISHENVTFATADVTDHGALKQAIQGNDFSYESLVYFPGSIVLKGLKAIKNEDVDSHFSINTKGALFAAQFAEQKLKSANGSVVFISSVAAQKGFMKHALISMCKAALEGLTVALAKELSPHIRVNCIAPSLTKTALSESLVSAPAVAKALGDAHAMKRLGEATDIASAIEFLISQQSSWITGQMIPVDGGRSTLD